MRRKTSAGAPLLRRYLLPESPLAAALLLVVLAAIAAEAISPLLVAAFIDGAVGGAALTTLRDLAIGYLASTAAFQVLSVTQAYLAERLAQNATTRLRADLTAHCLGLDMAFHAAHRPGELVERIEGDVTALGRFLSVMIAIVIGNVLLLVVVLVILLVAEWPVGLVMAGFLVLTCMVLIKLRGRAKPLWAQAMQADSEQSGFIGEHLTATEDIRSCGAIGYALGGFDAIGRRVLHLNRRAASRAVMTERVIEMLFSFGTGAGLAVGAWLVLRHSAPVGVIYLIYRYADLLATPVYRVNREFNVFQKAAAAASRVTELLNTRSALVDGTSKPASLATLPVEFDQVTYGYSPDRPVLRDVSFTVPAGERVGIVGRTGSGKTTIGRLLFRFADPDAGQIRLGGVPLTGMATADVRDRVGFVPQDVQIIHATVRDNLTFFDTSVTDELITSVLTELGLGEWLASLPGGLSAVLPGGDGGLSAGHAQLLALARVFLRDPQVVVLDEATSRLDPATERTIDRAIGRLLDGRTALVIAHRLATVQRVDRIVYLDAGQVVEEGECAHLAADPDSRFARLLRAGLERVTT